ncbi:hypothetical protein RB653_000008 [Dictyostelium firmibasis]|uniref:Uncharacterized protein n=1 Tax=Dictyostelium firmibasis TaxID=79012 RepID=A0AAN7YVL1_9MYCE
MKLINSFYISIITFSICSKSSDYHSNDNNQFPSNDEKSLNGYQTLIDLESANATLLTINSVEILKQRICDDECFQIDFIGSEIPIPIQMNNTFLVIVSCALLVLAFVNVLTF